MRRQEGSPVGVGKSRVEGIGDESRGSHSTQGVWKLALDVHELKWTENGCDFKGNSMCS